MSLDLIFQIIELEGLEVAVVTEDTVFVNIGDQIVAYNPIEDNALNHYLQNKYKICVDYKKEKVYSYRKGEGVPRSMADFHVRPNRAICECIVKKAYYNG